MLEQAGGRTWWPGLVTVIARRGARGAMDMGRHGTPSTDRGERGAKPSPVTDSGSLPHHMVSFTVATGE